MVDFLVVVLSVLTYFFNYGLEVKKFDKKITIVSNNKNIYYAFRN